MKNSHQLIVYISCLSACIPTKNQNKHCSLYFLMYSSWRVSFRYNLGTAKKLCFSFLLLSFVVVLKLLGL